MNGPNEGALPSVTDRAAGTVPVTGPAAASGVAFVNTATPPVKICDVAKSVRPSPSKSAAASPVGCSGTGTTVGANAPVVRPCVHTVTLPPWRLAPATAGRPLTRAMAIPLNAGMSALVGATSACPR